MHGQEHRHQNADTQGSARELRDLEQRPDSCLAAGHSCRRMVSRAFHDSLFMARVGPTGMIFIPCHKGYSHRPDEYTSSEAIGRGIEVLARTLSRLAEET